MKEGKGIQSCLWAEEEIVELSRIVERHLGKMGRKLYASVRVQRPTTILNAYMFDAQAQKIWVGDIEMGKDWQALLTLYGRLGTLYILTQEEGSSLSARPLLSQIRDRAAVIVEHRRTLYSRDFAQTVRLRKEKLQLHGHKR